MQEILIHCGIHKTGSSSIQQALAKNRQQLLGRGILYPSFRAHHFELYAAFCQDPLAYHMNRVRGLSTLTAVDAARTATLKSFEEELAACRSERVIVSAEDFSAMNADELSAFVSYLSSLGFKAIKFVVYLRDYVSYWESSLQQRIKGGAYIDFAEKVPHRIRTYRLFLEALSACSRRDNINIRIFNKAFLKNGDAVADFASCSGLDGLEMPTDYANQSLSWTAMLTLNALNKRVPRHTEAGTSIIFDEAISVLREDTRPSFRASRAMAEYILKASAEDREYLREWFDGRDPFIDILDANLSDPARENTPPSDSEIIDLLATLYAKAQIRAAENLAGKLHAVTRLARLRNKDAQANRSSQRYKKLIRRINAQD